MEESRKQHGKVLHQAVTLQHLLEVNRGGNLRTMFTERSEDNTIFFFFFTVVVNCEEQKGRDDLNNNITTNILLFITTLNQCLTHGKRER